MVRQSNTQTYPEIKKENLKPFLPHLSEPKKNRPMACLFLSSIIITKPSFVFIDCGFSL